MSSFPEISFSLVIRRSGRLMFLFAVALLAFSFRQPEVKGRPAEKGYELIEKHCLSCHGTARKSGLDLRTKESAAGGGLHGPALIPGDSKKSRLMLHLRGIGVPQMPPGSPLAEADIDTIAEWIDQGASFPSSGGQSGFQERSFTSEEKAAWYFQAPVKAPVPSGEASSAIDYLLEQALGRAGLAFSPEADKSTLIRRASFDVTGLPPEPQEVAAFLADSSPDAYAKLVDRLLASPAFGERWAQHWLDVVRFGETNGFELDAERDQAWRYRDYVVNALNSDLPYNQFLREQIAGDLLYPDSPSAHIAAGFLRAGPQHVVSGNLDKAELRQEYLTETMLGIGSGLMGLTVGCARCHDHKFDPIRQSDFYRLQAFFAGTENKDFVFATETETSLRQLAIKEFDSRTAPIKSALKELETPFLEAIRKDKRSRLEARYLTALETPAEKRTAEQKEDAGYANRMLEVKYEELLEVLPSDIKRRRSELRQQLHQLELTQPPPLPKALSVSEMPGSAPPVFVLKSGDVHSPLRQVGPGVPALLSPSFSSGSLTRQPGRIELADWLGSRSNPLTARVIVNRIWQHYFGKGLVATPNDFGKNGSGVSNQNLLDWLACDLMDNSWKLKRIHREILLSKAYRQSYTNSPAGTKADPGNKLFWRQDLKRLDAEELRDAILAASGTLNRQMGGPSIKVPMEPEVIETIFTEFEPDNLWPVNPDPAQHTRRSLYLLRKRNVRLPLLVAYDAPDLMSVCGARNVSTHALQSLSMMNSSFMQSQSRALAARILSAAKPENSRLRLMFRMVLGRGPTVAELEKARRFLRAQQGLISQSSSKKEKAGPAPPAGESPTVFAVWTDLALAMLNLNEFVYLK